jgi:hypothetical protein
MLDMNGLDSDILDLDIGLQAHYLPREALEVVLRVRGGVGLVSAAQPRNVQHAVQQDGVIKYAVKCTRPEICRIFFKVVDGWGSVDVPRLPNDAVRIPIPVRASVPTTWVYPPCPCKESISRIGAVDLRTMSMLCLTEVLLRGNKKYWKDIPYKDTRMFKDMPNGAIATIGLAVAVRAPGCIALFDPRAERVTYERIKHHAAIEGLAVLNVNKRPRDAQSVYEFVGGRSFPFLKEFATHCLQKNVNSLNKK